MNEQFSSRLKKDDEFISRREISFCVFFSRKIFYFVEVFTFCGLPETDLHQVERLLFWPLLDEERK